MKRLKRLTDLTLRAHLEFDPINPSTVDPYKFLVEYSADILLYDFENDRHKTIGTIEAVSVDLKLAESHPNAPSLQVIFDAQETQWAHLYEDLTTNNNLQATILFVNHFDKPEIMLIERINVLEPYRNKSYGSQALICFIKTLAKRAEVFIKPFPIDLSNKCKEGSPRRKERMDEATERLRRLYRRLGFIDLPNVEFMLYKP